jgi:NTP pyrophosphatase (non-canonical NTP hydrolase)
MSAMTTPEAIAMVLEELEIAKYKFPEWPTDPVHQAAIVAEESGELVRAVLQTTYEPHKDANPIKEAVQTAAMAIRFLEEYQG